VNITIDPSERWLILGKTGSGKTQFAKHMLRIVAKSMPVVIVDPNELWLGRGKGGRPEDWAQKKEVGTIDKPRLINEYNPKWHVQCLQPDVDGSEEDPRLARLCFDILKKGNVFVYFDESEGIATATHVPRYIRRIWKTGRAHNVGCWVSTQAPKGIPRIFKSQAEKFVVFKVGDEDIDYAAGLGHAVKEEVASLGRFEWLFYDNKAMDYAEWNAPIPFEEKK
jgi:energy-coupling factor transporter ATP-binding protein EcfA2